MLCDYVTRGYGDHPPLTIAASVERRRRSAWGGAAVPLFFFIVGTEDNVSQPLSSRGKQFTTPKP